VPWHLTTLEFARKIKAHLEPDGAYMMNIIDNYSTGLFVGASYLTLKRVFPHVYVFCTDTSGVGTSRETFVVVASASPLDISDWGPKHGTGFAGSALTEDNLEALRRKCRDRILTDDNAPVENLLARVVRK
jgi:spermidine synthase